MVRQRRSKIFDCDGNDGKNTLDCKVNFDPGQAVEGYVQIEFPKQEPYVINIVPENASGALAKIGQTASSEPFIPKNFNLIRNFPNPFNPTTQIVFDLPKDANVNLTVYDVNGNQVANLVNGYKSAGRYLMVFDGHNLASGVYIYRLITNTGIPLSKKIILVR